MMFSKEQLLITKIKLSQVVRHHEPDQLFQLANIDHWHPLYALALTREHRAYHQGH